MCHICKTEVRGILDQKLFSSGDKFLAYT